MSKHDNNNKIGQRHRFKNLVFWAEEGMICIEDQRDGDFKVLTRAEGAARAVALNAELSHMNTHPNDRDELCKAVVGMAACVKEAKTQGDPTNVEVRRQKIRDNRRVSMLLPRLTTGLDAVDNSLIIPGL